MKKKNFLNRISFSKLFLFINILLIFLVFVFTYPKNSIDKKREQSFLLKFINQRLSLRTFVCEEAELLANKRRLTLCVYNNSKLEKILVTSNFFPVYDYGDYLYFFGKIDQAKSFNDFDYPRYLARRNIFTLSYYPELTKIDGRLSFFNKIKKILINLRQKSVFIINKSLPEPESSLAATILLGYKKRLDNEELDVFSRVGIRHLIAISGVHVAIISRLIILVLEKLYFSRKKAIFFVVIFLLSYPLITGFSSSALRASIMGLFAFLAMYFNRPSQALRLLLITASLMLAINPWLLNYDIGFQLSFMAVLAIIFSGSFLKQYIELALEDVFSNSKKKKIAFYACSVFALSFIVQIFSWPIMFFNFSEFSLISPLVNIFLIWLLPFVLISLILAIVFSAIIPSLSLYFFFPSYLFIRFIFFVSNIFSGLSFASLKTFKPSIFFVVLYYLLLFYFIKRKTKNFPDREVL